MERDFREHFVESLRVQRFHVVDIPDDIKAAHKQGGLPKRMGTIKPYDLGVLKGGLFYGIELKWVGKGLSWPVNDLQHHQEINLLQVDSHGGVAVVIVQFQLSKPPEKLMRSGLGEFDGPHVRKDVFNRVFVLPVTKIVHDRKVKGTTSYSIEELSDSAPIIRSTHMYQDSSGLPMSNAYNWIWDFEEIHTQLHTEFKMKARITR